MNANIRNEQIWLAVGSLMVLAATALAAILIYTRGVLIPFVLAIFVTTVVSPVVDLQVIRWRFPDWLAILIALCLVLAILATIGIVLTIAVQMIVHLADEYSEQVVELTKRLVAQLNARGIHVDHASIAADLESRLPDMIKDGAGTVTTLLSNGFLIAFFVLFMLAGRSPHKRRQGIYADIDSAIRGYVTAKTAISAIAGLLVGLILWALGLRMAFLFGLMAFLLNFIPNVGPVIASLLPLPIAIAQFDNPWMIAAVVGLPGMVHMTIGNIVEPRLMGRGLELHPVTVLMALAFWGLLWGVVGMVLAVPIMATLRIVLTRFNTTRGLGQLLAGRLPGVEPTVPIV